MLDFSHIPTSTGNAIVYEFTGTSQAAFNDWQVWSKPRGKNMAFITLIGKGGNGGNGAVGANSTAAGGGGGGGGAEVNLLIPLAAIPDNLYLSLIGATATTTLASYITIAPSAAAVAQNTLAIANGGVNGGNATGATAGTAGTGGAVATAATMPLGWQWANTVLVANSGIAGGTTAAGGALAMPTTMVRVLGGTGGGGLPAAAAVGTAGGSLTNLGTFPPNPGGAGGSSATVPGQDGSNGHLPFPGLQYIYGGTGGGSSHGSATTTGLFGGKGGAGIMGSGGGGGGGCLTGGVAGTGGQGGAAYCRIVCW